MEQISYIQYLLEFNFHIKNIKICIKNERTLVIKQIHLEKQLQIDAFKTSLRLATAS